MKEDILLAKGIHIKGQDVFNQLAGSIVTGVTTGGEVTANVDTTKYDIAAGTGVVINWVDPSAPTIKTVSWTEKLAVVSPDITLLFTVNGIDENGDLVHGGAGLNVSGVQFTNEQERAVIILQSVISLDGVNVTGIGSSSRPSYEVIAAIIDWIQTHGALNTGNLYESASATTMSKSVGTTESLFINRDANPQNPTPITNDAQPTVSYIGSYRDNPSGFISELPTTTIVLDKIDDGSGTLVTMGNNKWAIRRDLFFGSVGATTKTYGQAEYSSKEEAKAAIFTEAPVLNPQLSSGIFTTALIHKKGADLTVPAEYEFVPIENANTGAPSVSVGIERIQPINYASCETSNSTSLGVAYYTNFVPPSSKSGVTKIRFKITNFSSVGDLDVALYAGGSNIGGVQTISITGDGFFEVTISSQNILAGVEYQIGLSQKSGAWFYLGEVTNTGLSIASVETIPNPYDLPATVGTESAGSATFWFELR